MWLGLGSRSPDLLRVAAAVAVTLWLLWLGAEGPAHGQTETTPRRALTPGRWDQKATMCSFANTEPLLAIVRV